MSEHRLERPHLLHYRRAIITHLVSQSGGPTANPVDALRLAKNCYGLIPREAPIGRFTACISPIAGGEWALDFNPFTPKHILVAALWHELAELLCMSDDMICFENFGIESYCASAGSASDLRHMCAVGVERFVRRKLREIPELRAEQRADTVRRILIIRAAVAPGEPVLPSIEREPWYDDESPSVNDA